MTEYLYDRDNPKSHFRQRISGIQGLFFGVPNINERADMIGRYVKPINRTDILIEYI
jgi:hypothetical protein